MTIEKNTSETLMTEKEVAQYLKISAKTVSRHRESGAIGFYKMGGRVMFSFEKHVQPYLETCNRSAKSTAAATV